MFFFLTILLPIFLVVETIVLFHSVFKNGFRESLIKAFISLSIFVLITNETLSSLNLLIPSYLKAIYLITVLLLGGYIYTKKMIFKGVKNIYDSLFHITNYFSPVFLKVILFILFLLFALSIYIAPNNVDAMGYHIPRVIFWAQNHNLDHFPTVFFAQLFYNVQFEYFLLHAYMLFENDLLFNVIQWFTLIIILVGTSQILHLWSFNSTIQGYGVIVCLSLPLSILTATSSKNDLLSACYLLLSIYFGLKVLQKESNWNNIFFFILSFILAGFTKYSAWMLGFPLALGFGIVLVIKDFIKSLKILSIFLCSTVVLFFGFFYRNYALFGQLIRPTDDSQLAVPSYSNEILTWKTIISNMLKMAGNNISLPWDYWNHLMDSIVFNIHDWIHFDPNNLKTAWSSYLTNFTINEDYSGNFLHFFLIIFSIIICLYFKSLRKSIQFQYFLLLFGGLLIYALLIKWSAFNARTQLPYFIAIVPFITFSFAKWNVRMLKVICFLLLMQTIPFLFFNANKKIVPIYYWFKKEIAHLPKSIFYDKSNSTYADSLVNVKIYKKEIDVKGRQLLELNSNLSISQKKLGFSILDRNHVFKADKLSIFSNLNRNAHYVGFVPDEDNFYINIFKDLGTQRKKIGLISISSTIAPFFTLGRHFNGPDFEIKYIQFPSIFAKKIDINNYLNYEAIITDDENFINGMDKINVKIFKEKDWYVIIPLKPSKKLYLID